jgi:hypothetical protein
MLTTPQEVRMIELGTRRFRDALGIYRIIDPWWAIFIGSFTGALRYAKYRECRNHGFSVAYCF